MLVTIYSQYLKFVNSLDPYSLHLYPCPIPAWGQGAMSLEEVASHGLTAYDATEGILPWNLLIVFSTDISPLHIEMAKQKGTLPFRFPAYSEGHPWQLYLQLYSFE